MAQTLESVMCYEENTGIEGSSMARMGLIKVESEKRLERGEELSRAVNLEKIRCKQKSTSKTKALLQKCA